MKPYRSGFRRRLCASTTASILSLSVPVIYADAAGQWRDGAQVYAKTCSFCHDTGIGPALVGRNLPPEYISTVVRNGFRAMPTFRSAEIDDIALEELSIYVSSAAADRP